jgi:hypothetical protein
MPDYNTILAALAVLLVLAAVAFVRWWQRNVAILFEPLNEEEDHE